MRVVTGAAQERRNLTTMKDAQKKLDYFPWYASKYAADTTHLTREADYAYRRLLDHIFLHEQTACRIADDDELLRNIARATAEEWPTIRRALIDGARPLLRKRGSWISSPKLTVEIRKAQKLYGSRAEGGRTRSKSSPDAEHNLTSSSARQNKKNPTDSKKSPSDSRKENLSVLTPALPRNGIEALDVVRGALSKLAPQLVVDDQQISLWLRDTIHDPWRLAAALCEEWKYLAKCRAPAYVAAILKRKAENPGEPVMSETFEARVYAEHVFTSLELHRDELLQETD